MSLRMPLRLLSLLLSLRAIVNDAVGGTERAVACHGGSTETIEVPYDARAAAGAVPVSDTKASR